MTNNDRFKFRVWDKELERFGVNEDALEFINDDREL